jgi:hypothetical protein
VEAVTDVAEIVRSGIVGTPALLIDERVVVSGRVPTVPELVAMLGTV